MIYMLKILLQKLTLDFGTNRRLHIQPSHRHQSQAGRQTGQTESNNWRSPPHIPYTVTSARLKYLKLIGNSCWTNLEDSFLI